MAICSASPLPANLRSKTIKRVPAYYGLKMIHSRSQRIGLQLALIQNRPVECLTSYLHRKEWRYKGLPPPYLPGHCYEPSQHPQDTLRLVILISPSTVNDHQVYVLLLLHTCISPIMNF